MGITSFHLHPSGFRWILLSPLFQMRRLTPESRNDLPKAGEPSWHLQKIQPRTLDGQTRVLFPASLEISKGFPKGPTKGSSYNCTVDRTLSWGFISGIPLATLGLQDMCPLFALSLLPPLPPAMPAFICWQSCLSGPRTLLFYEQDPGLCLWFPRGTGSRHPTTDAPACLSPRPCWVLGANVLWSGS